MSERHVRLLQARAPTGAERDSCRASYSCSALLCWRGAHLLPVALLDHLLQDAAVAGDVHGHGAATVQHLPQSDSASKRSVAPLLSTTRPLREPASRRFAQVATCVLKSLGLGQLMLKLTRHGSVRHFALTFALRSISRSLAPPFR